MTDVVLSSSDGIVLAVAEATSTINTTSTESVIVQSNGGNVVTVGGDSAVLVEVTSQTVLITGLVGPAGAAGIPEEDIMYSKRVDFITDNLLYRGEAVVGSSESASVWRVRRVVIGVDGDVTELWASGTANFDKAWADRASFIYS